MDTISSVEPTSAVAAAVWASFWAGSATLIGASGVLFFRRFTAKVADILLSVAAGVMLAAAFFSLLLPGLEHADQALGHPVAGFLLVSAGVVLGALFIWVIHDALPHEHIALGRDGPEVQRIQRIWLLVFAMVLHNLPEGMAVGVAMMQEPPTSGMALAVGMGLQNIPEGLATAVALRAIGYAPWVAVAAGGASGWVEPLGSLLAATLVALTESLLGLFLGVAAGAMLFVVLDEVVPEVHRQRAGHHVSSAMLAGFLVMMALDVLLAA